MEFIKAEKFDEEARKSIKYFPDELVATLSEENRKIYDSWTSTEYKEINRFSAYDFEKMFPVLEEMQSHIVGIIPNETMNMYVKAVINQIMLENDKIRYPIYVEYLDQKKQKAHKKYYELKSEYDKKSKIGKFIARLTGKERELEDAKREFDRAHGSSIAIQSQGDKVYRHKGEWIQVENGAIVTPAEYEERLRLLEEEKNGRSR